MEKFSFDTIKDFDEHISKSIPSYSLLSDMIVNISEYFIQNDEVIYDLGCSTGSMLKKMPPHVRKVGYDNSSLLPMSSYKNLQFIKTDLTKGFLIENACIALSIFTMQFLPKRFRKQFCDTIYNGLNTGGAFILCEKVYSENSCMQEAMTMCHYQHKMQNFSLDEIHSKERDLREIMKPLTLNENIAILNQSGFSVIESFWRSYNFIGLICIKR